MFCGIDLGTSSVKAAVYDEVGRTLACARRECELVTPKAGWSELDPEDYLDKLYQVIREASEDSGQRITAVAISSQAQAVLPIDENGKPLYNIIVTMDNRTIPQYMFWKENYDEKEIYGRTGNTFGSIYTLNKIMWHKQNQPEIYNRAWKFCCVQDYAAYMLTGEGPYTDYSIAGRTMMFSVKEPVWDEKVLGIAGIDIGKLSSPVPSVTVVGKIRTELRQKLKLDETCEVVIGGHDQACGAIGSGVVKPGMLMDACGTVDAMVTVLPGMVLSDKMQKYSLTCYRHADTSNYITMAINTNGGLFLKWYKNVLYDRRAENGRDIYTQMIEECPDTPSDIYVLPHLEGAGTPYNDPESLAAIVGLRVCHTKKDITRAVLDSLAYEMKLNLEAVENATNCKIDEIRMIGGGAKTPKWVQIKADIFNKKIVTLETDEAASLGAAIIGAVAKGYYKSFDEAINKMIHIKKIYYPDIRMQKEYGIRASEYQDIYEGLKKVNHNISSRTLL
ncbi:Hsp70 family protein [Ruminococcus sp. CLA-AA-H200]|uniref:Hsp70 family protein n=1 Tax=Ruminococcus turbiniformis TaxID=2881258 RepID=A0ABS8FXG7_9FIRM|nr:FGGY-family carbohydrate kinase [Ruminococcus turbiniformis]MCC2254299.1 Hsp70 family protein [Ruminococcus turbiniformis]